jgi:PHD/YefM family antitoxin component YafN of YafNO toxin-antitoxin module
MLDALDTWRPDNMSRLSTRELQEEIVDALDRVATRGERIVVQHRQKDAAVLISLQDFALLKRLEDRLDLEAIRKSKAELGPDVDWDDLKKECGL